MLFCLLSAHKTTDTEYSLGLVLDDAAHEAAPRLPHFDGIKYHELPRKIDLKPYSPIPKHQGKIGSCVGWSLGYNALTIQNAAKHQWRNRRLITQNAFSALYLYNQTKISDCYGGAVLTDALAFLSRNGDCFSREFDGDVNNCQKYPNFQLTERASNYAIQDYHSIFSLSDSYDHKILQTKQSLSSGRPVVIGIEVRRNFATINRGNPFWQPHKGDMRAWGGHAVVVIGYDDGKRAFEVMNSWGTAWADAGFAWIKYNDFSRFARYGYQIHLYNDQVKQTSTYTSPVPQPPVSTNTTVHRYVKRVNPKKLEEERKQAFIRKKMEEAKKAVLNRKNQAEARKHLAEQIKKDMERRACYGTRLAGNFVFQYLLDDETLEFASAEPIFKRDHYILRGSRWKVGQLFQLIAQNELENEYIYVFSVDAQNQVNIHWPRQANLDQEKFGDYNESSFIPYAGAQVVIPHNEGALEIAHKGKDNLCVFFSCQKIDDFKQITKQVRDQTDPNQDLMTRLREVLKHRLINQKYIFYYPQKIGFKTLPLESGTIMPLVLEVEAS